MVEMKGHRLQPRLRRKRARPRQAVALPSHLDDEAASDPPTEEEGADLGGALQGQTLIVDIEDKTTLAQLADVPVTPRPVAMTSSSSSKYYACTFGQN